MRNSSLISIVTLFVPYIIDSTYADELPNFVWMMSEDVSPQFLGLYNNGDGAKTPNIDYLARNGIMFNNAYSNAPVSSAARSTLITGCYAPRLGASFHRGLTQVSLPESLCMFPSYLRKAGYHTSNASKTDYNCILDETAWDVVNGKMGEWRNRKNKDQPFFFVRTNAASHESCLHFDVEKRQTRLTKHDPQKVNILPVHPDTELFRYTYAVFYDHIQQVDEELGELISMLKEDGELDNTFIFYFGDNGGSLPGSKGYTTETGLKIPLVVYIPEKWRDRISIPVSARIDGFVSFMDFGSTLLHLAGLEVLDLMDGTPFLGNDISLEQVNARNEVYGYGDRFDELYAFNRTIRKCNFKYSRNFQPYQPKSLFSVYRYRQLAFREWKTLYKAGELNEVQAQFFEPQGCEELYDLSIDPYEINNLATDPIYADKLKEMRVLLQQYMLDKNDLGLLPESIWLEEDGKSPVTYGALMHNRLVRLMEISNLQLVSFDIAVEEIKKALNSTDPAERYWALTTCISFGTKAVSLSGMSEKILENDPSAIVRSKALVFLSVLKKVNPVTRVRDLLEQANSEAETLLILNDVAYLYEGSSLDNWKINKEKMKYSSEVINWRIDYLNGMYE